MIDPVYQGLGERQWVANVRSVPWENVVSARTYRVRLVRIECPRFLPWNRVGQRRGDLAEDEQSVYCPMKYLQKPMFFFSPGETNSCRLAACGRSRFILNQLSSSRIRMLSVACHVFLLRRRNTSISLNHLFSLISSLAGKGSSRMYLK